MLCPILLNSDSAVVKMKKLLIRIHRIKWDCGLFESSALHCKLTLAPKLSGFNCHFHEMQLGTNACCILVEKKKFFDISLRGTPVDWKTLLLITEVTVQHTNLKFSEERKLCSSSRKTHTHTHTRTHTHKQGTDRVPVFFFKKSCALHQVVLLFMYFFSLLFVHLLFYTALKFRDM